MSGICCSRLQSFNAEVVVDLWLIAFLDLRLQNYEIHRVGPTCRTYGGGPFSKDAIFTFVRLRKSRFLVVLVWTKGPWRARETLFDSRRVLQFVLTKPGNMQAKTVF